MPEIKDLSDKADSATRKLSFWGERFENQSTQLAEQLARVRTRVEASQRIITQQDRENRQLKEENVWLRNALSHIISLVEQHASVPATFSDLSNVVAELVEATKKLETTDPDPTDTLANVDITQDSEPVNKEDRLMDASTAVPHSRYDAG